VVQLVAVVDSVGVGPAAAAVDFGEALLAVVAPLADLEVVAEAGLVVAVADHLP